MIRRFAFAAAAFALSASAHAQTPKGGHMPAPIVFFDIAGPDTTQLSRFYATVFDWSIAADGRFSAPVSGPRIDGLPAIDATLRKDPADKIIYIGVPDVTATLAAITANGGRVVAPRFEVKGVVVLGLFTDPAGNSMGLVEMAGDKAKVP